MGEGVMAAKSEWAKLPIRWIHEGALVDFRGRSTRPSSRLFLHLVQPEVDAPALRNESLAALKLFLVLCCRADFSTGMAKVRISLIVTGHFANNVTGFSTRLRGV